MISIACGRSSRPPTTERSVAATKHGDGLADLPITIELELIEQNLDLRIVEAPECGHDTTAKGRLRLLEQGLDRRHARGVAESPEGRHRLFHDQWLRRVGRCVGDRFERGRIGSLTERHERCNGDVGIGVIDRGDQPIGDGVVIAEVRKDRQLCRSAPDASVWITERLLDRRRLEATLTGERAERRRSELRFSSAQGIVNDLA